MWVGRATKERSAKDFPIDGTIALVRSFWWVLLQGVMFHQRKVRQRLEVDGFLGSQCDKMFRRKGCSRDSSWSHLTQQFTLGTDQDYRTVGADERTRERELADMSRRIDEAESMDLLPHQTASWSCGDAIAFRAVLLVSKNDSVKVLTSNGAALI